MKLTTTVTVSILAVAANSIGGRGKILGRYPRRLRAGTAVGEPYVLTQPLEFKDPGLILDGLTPSLGQLSRQLFAHPCTLGLC